MGEWKTYKLGDLISLYSGGTPNKGNASFWNGDIPWISAKSMYDDFLETSDLYITELGLKNGSKLAKKGTILLLTRGSGLFNRIPVCWTIRDLAYNQDVKNIVSKNESLVSTEYLFYWLYGNKDAISSILETTGIGAGKLDTDRFLNLDVSLPSLKRQGQILRTIKPLFDKIIINNRINHNLEEQAQALYKSWFVDFEPFKGCEFVNSELGMIPKDLEIKQIGEIHHTIESGKRPKGGITEVINGVPSIGAESIKGLGIYDYSKTKYVSRDFANSMKKGTIKGYELLIYKDGGKPGYFIPNFSIFGEGFPFDEMTTNEHVFILDFGDRGFNAFSYFFFQTDGIMNYLNAQGGKAAIPGINRNDIESIFIFTPQNQLIRDFGERVTPMIQSILNRCKENRQLSLTRDSLLPRLLSADLQLYYSNC